MLLDFVSRKLSSLIYVKSFLVTILAIPIVDAALTSFPTDTEAVVGQTVRINCSTSDKYYVLWEHTPVGAANYEYVFFSGRIVKPYHLRHRIEGNSSAGEYHLVITNVQSSDAGLYGCVDQAGHGERKEAQLIVLVSQPTCSSSDEIVGENPCGVPEEQVKIQCEIEYSGNKPPTLECGVKVNFIGTASVANATKTSQTKATYDLNVNPMRLKDSTLVCRTWQSRIASNDFSTKVLYMQKEPSIRTLSRPEHLICVFESSLPCRYRWLHPLSNNGFISGDVILKSRSGLHQCRVECSLRDKQCIVLSETIHVEIPEEENIAAQSGTQTHVVILATVCVVVPVIIIGLICLCIYCRKKSEQSGRCKPNHEYENRPTLKGDHNQMKSNPVSSDGNINQLEMPLVKYSVIKT